MTERTFRVLEYDKIRQMLAAQAASSLGQERALHLRPQTSLARIQQWQQETSEACRLLDEKGGLPLGGLHDVRPALRQAAIGGLLAPTDLLQVGDTLRCARRFKEFLAESEDVPRLQALAAQLTPCPDLEQELERCLGDEGEILDTASAKLHRLRQRMKSLHASVLDRLQDILAAPQYAGMIQEFLITTRAGRYCIPIKSSFQARFRGLVHDTSASGATVFMEPEAVVPLNNQLRQLEAEEQHEIERLLRELTQAVAAREPELRVNVTTLGILDFIAAKAHLSRALDCVEPELNTDGVLDLRQARHPLLVQAAHHSPTPPPTVVPIDLRLGEDFTTLVITGPNTGGKTVTLKTAGLLTLMAQSGLHIPAAPGSRVAVFRQVFADIGDEQSIEQSLSTFSSHTNEIVRILRAVRPKALVLLDEIGAGTDPAEGAALARAVLQYLHHRDVRTIATTHYSELKTFAYTEPGIENASVEFDVETLQPTFRLLIGVPGSSHAFTIAERLGLPRKVVEHAQQFLSDEKVRVDELIIRMEETQRRLDHELTVAERDAQALEQQREELAAEREFLEELERDIRQRAVEEAEALVKQAQKEAQEILARLRREQREGKATEEARQQLRELHTKVVQASPEPSQEAAPPVPPKSLSHAPTPPLSHAPTPSPQVWTSAPERDLSFQPGDSVYVARLRQNGTVLSEVEAGEVEIQVGSMRLKVPVKELERRKAAPSLLPARSGASDILRAKSYRVPDEVHLRGMTVDEALLHLDKYLDDALLAGRSQVRIVHGKGTGALREAVRQYLRNHPHIASFEFAQALDGGIGVTVARLAG